MGLSKLLFSLFLGLTLALGPFYVQVSIAHTDSDHNHEVSHTDSDHNHEVSHADDKHIDCEVAEFEQRNFLSLGALAEFDCYSCCDFELFNISIAENILAAECYEDFKICSPEVTFRSAELLSEYSANHNSFISYQLVRIKFETEPIFALTQRIRI